MRDRVIINVIVALFALLLFTRCSVYQPVRTIYKDGTTTIDTVRVREEPRVNVYYNDYGRWNGWNNWGFYNRWNFYDHIYYQRPIIIQPRNNVKRVRTPKRRQQVRQQQPKRRQAIQTPQRARSRSQGSKPRAPKARRN